ncbi:hypothetical protein POM88_035953 [Heracleum sosnowskyi]|uniref:Aspartate/glutamate/uridylate kinase domain-containing protein n=1 Tax=Heracleum sosnowskyi TaxID=360622 RepID=A0AAD8HMH4_9APIA|nr:hypothetical protein POM88_035953 [Heracleum sosnowskyi]
MLIGLLTLQFLLSLASLGRVRKIQVWKDVDGVLTCDPNINQCAEPVLCLTFDEASELSYFGAQVFSIFEDMGISVDVVATSEELDNVIQELERIAMVNLLQHRSIISLIGNVQISSLILEQLQP